jgi:hypothetical protein
LGPTPCYLVKIDTLNVSRACFGAVSGAKRRKCAQFFLKKFPNVKLLMRQSALLTKPYFFIIVPGLKTEFWLLRGAPSITPWIFGDFPDGFDRL